MKAAGIISDHQAGWMHTPRARLYPDICTGTFPSTEQSLGDQAGAGALQLNICFPADKERPLVAAWYLKYINPASLPGVLLGEVSSEWLWRDIGSWNHYSCYTTWVYFFFSCWNTSYWLQRTLITHWWKSAHSELYWGFVKLINVVHPEWIHLQ